MRFKVYIRAVVKRKEKSFREAEKLKLRPILFCHDKGVGSFLKKFQGHCGEKINGFVHQPTNQPCRPTVPSRNTRKQNAAV